MKSALLEKPQLTLLSPENRGGYQLRDYQRDLIEAIYQAWKQHKRLLVQLPTGGGKTVIFAIITRLFVSNGKRVLILVHRQELLDQAKEKVEVICGVPVGIIKAGYPLTPDAPIQIASVQTLANRQLWFEPALVLTDEAHHAAAASYTEIYDRYPDAYQLGLTATPRRLDGKGLDHLFETLIHGPSVKQLIEEGYLSSYRLFAAAAQIDTKGVRTTAGDYNQGQLRQAAMSAAIMGQVVSNWKQYAGGKQTIVFAVDVAHSIEVCKLFQDAGIKAVHLDGNTPTEQRRTTLQQFENKELTVLCNCGIVSEGLDIPGIEAVQILRPTKSVPLYLQQIGRALRPAPGKEHAIILDHTSNWLNHGLPDDDREWNLDGSVTRPERKLERTKDGEVKEKVERDLSIDLTVRLAEVVSTNPDPDLIAKLEGLIHHQQQRRYKPGWVVYRFLECNPGIAELRECARRLGYKPGWAMYQMRQLQGGAA